MPVANVRGANINYQVLGTHGPWVALSPGGRRALDNVKPLAQHMAGRGYRVLIHDRRNCGISDLVDRRRQVRVRGLGRRSLRACLAAQRAAGRGRRRLVRLPAVAAVCAELSAGVRALLLWRVTGGAFAAERLTENYYSKYIRAAQEGGMAAVCALDHFQERIEAKPANRATLMAMDPKKFIAAMERWQRTVRQGRRASRSSARASGTSIPSRCRPASFPGNDRTHNHAVAETAHRMIPGSELHDLFPGDLDVDLVPPEDWAPKEAEMAAIFADFLKRAQRKAA